MYDPDSSSASAGCNSRTQQSCGLEQLSCGPGKQLRGPEKQSSGLGQLLCGLEQQSCGPDQQLLWTKPAIRRAKQSTSLVVRESNRVGWKSIPICWSKTDKSSNVGMPRADKSADQVNPLML